MSLHDLKNEIQSLANPEKGKLLQRFFKTGEGEYAEGDIFLGLTVPQSRSIAKKYVGLPLIDVTHLLKSKMHEERLIALIILVEKFQKGDETVKKEIYELYLAHTEYINNWDLVDLSAEYIVGEYLFETLAFDKLRHERFSLSEQSESKGLEVLTNLAHSESIWERRIAIISTFQFIKRGEPEPTFTIAEILLHDKHDLIHKAVGWMLREVGKRVSQEDEEAFLKRYYKTMPRTMLRYAIERFPEEKRKRYLLGTI